MGARGAHLRSERARSESWRAELVQTRTSAYCSRRAPCLLTSGRKRRVVVAQSRATLLESLPTPQKRPAPYELGHRHKSHTNSMQDLPQDGSVPTVDIAQLSDPHLLAAAVVKALSTTGFLFVRGHGLDDQVESMFRIAGEADADCPAAGASISRRRAYLILDLDFQQSISSRTRPQKRSNDVRTPRTKATQAFRRRGRVTPSCCRVCRALKLR